MIPCKTISRIWHWHLTMCMRFPRYPLVFQVVQWVIQGFCERDVKYRQASSGIVRCWRRDYTINWIFWYNLSQHFEYGMYRDLVFLLYVILV
ncbi:hypothetical protein F383_04662 [Gossypium arboreum]|uniref:Uncharacterized protein n=1 Tax=Gossypium arboreum TaxID=29729 RepID=A0A0B0P5R0_GOSAR|nr:hypothetical protein F383_04662 [Gossypium arboreum]